MKHFRRTVCFCIGNIEFGARRAGMEARPYGCGDGSGESGKPVRMIAHQCKIERFTKKIKIPCHKGFLYVRIKSKD